MQVVIAGFAIVLALVVAGAREFKHATEPTAAIVTPQMNAQAEIGRDLGSRIHRFAETRSHGAIDHPKLIALTFDDGPYPMFTPLLLEELRSLNVPATFFLIGRDAEQWPGLARASKPTATRSQTTPTRIRIWTKKPRHRFVTSCSTAATFYGASCTIRPCAR